MAKLTGDDARLAKLEAKLDDNDKMGKLISSATKQAVSELYLAGFTSTVSPWGEAWKPAKYSKGKSAGYVTGQLAGTPIFSDHSPGVLTGVKMRQANHGRYMQVGAPKPKGEGVPLDTAGTVRATLAWSHGSNWDGKVEANFERIISDWFSGV